MNLCVQILSKQTSFRDTFTINFLFSFTPDPINNILDSQTAFVSLTLFNTMRGPLFLLPFGIVSIIQGMVSIGRINSFLNLEEINPNNVSASTYSSHPKRSSIDCVAVL